MAPYRDAMRVWVVEQGGGGTSWYWERAAPDYNEDDPITGKSADLLVGRWVSGRELLQPEVYEFRKNGQWLRQQDQLGQPLRQQGLYRWEANGNLVLLPYEEAFAKLDKKTRDSFAEGSKRVYRVAFTKGKLVLSFADLNRLNGERRLLGLPPLTGKEDLGETGIIFRREP